jgi:FMN reductase
MMFVGIGGTMRNSSSSEAALRLCMSPLEASGHATQIFTGPDLDLPMYDPRTAYRTAEARRLVDAVRRADGVVLCSPGYHGGISGLIKNAIDYLEDTAGDDRPYFDGIPVGCVAVAYGYQGASTTLGSLRDVAHALRGWPTPFGAAINAKSWLNGNGEVASSIAEGLGLVAHQMMTFAAKAPREAEAAREAGLSRVPVA